MSNIKEFNKNLILFNNEIALKKIVFTIGKSCNIKLQMKNKLSSVKKICNADADNNNQLFSFYNILVQPKKLGDRSRKQSQFSVMVNKLNII